MGFTKVFTFGLPCADTSHHDEWDSLLNPADKLLITVCFLFPLLCAGVSGEDPHTDAGAGRGVLLRSSLSGWTLAKT